MQSADNLRQDKLKSSAQYSSHDLMQTISGFFGIGDSNQENQAKQKPDAREILDETSPAEIA